MSGALCRKLHRPPVAVVRTAAIIARNRDFCPRYRRSQSEHSHDVWYRKTRMVWLPDGEKNWRYIYSFRQNSRTWQTDGQTDTAWRHRPRLHSIAQQTWSHHRRWNFNYPRQTSPQPHRVTLNPPKNDLDISLDLSGLGQGHFRRVQGHLRTSHTNSSEIFLQQTHTRAHVHMKCVINVVGLWVIVQHIHVTDNKKLP